MNFYIIIPAHNEENYIEVMLHSLTTQTLLPKKVVIVNDNSSDKTLEIANNYAKTFNWINVVSLETNNKHVPGSKVINAFYEGFKTLDSNYDIIAKFDADIILPSNYLERISQLFSLNKHIGIAGGLAYIKKENSWVYETVASKNHVRGPFKAYRKNCFRDIGGIKQSIGWDTVDVLLALKYNWQVKTDHTLKIKHLKPTGKNYNKSSAYLQGEAFYKMRYGFTLSFLSSLKKVFKTKKIVHLKNDLIGFYRAKKNKLDFIVSPEEGKFIRQYRWKSILEILSFKKY